MDIEKINFDKMNGLVPAVIQDAGTARVLMLGFMNNEALQRTVETQRVTFFSRTKNALWTKGETSGNFLNLVSIKIDCDMDTLLISVNPQGPACHTGSDTCFQEDNKVGSRFLDELERIICDRKLNPIEGSYTDSLFKKGLNKIAQKVGEEAVEVVIAAKDDDDDALKSELADLFYHTLVLMRERNVALEDLAGVLESRNKK